MHSRLLMLVVLTAVSVVGCGSDGSGDGPDSISDALRGTWVNESRDLARKIVIGDGPDQAFTNVDDTDPWSETECVNDDEWIDDAGDFWGVTTCTEIIDGAITESSWCSLGRVSADGSVWEWNTGAPGSCPQGHGAGHPPTFRYERVDT